MSFDPLDRARLLPRLEAAGFAFSKSMGQNFVTAAWVPETLAEAAGCDGGSVLEIGPGAGALTRALAKRAASVCALELDGRILPVLREATEDFDNVTICRGDVLTADLDALAREHLEKTPRVAAANLPYNITTDAVDRLVYCGLFSRVAVMVQREAARRLLAGPGDGDWCLAAARLRWKCRARAVSDVPPDCFVPAPRVTSTILRLELRDTPLCPTKSEAALLRVLAAAFRLRRKTFLNSASAALSLPKGDVARALERLGLDPAVRGEALTIQQLAALSDLLL